MGTVAATLVVAAAFATAVPRAGSSAQLTVTALVVRPAVIAIATAPATPPGPPRAPGDASAAAGRASGAAVGAGAPVIFTDGAPPSFTVRVRTAPTSGARPGGSP